MLVEIQTCRESRTDSGQDDGRVRVVSFESVECIVEVGEELPILRVDGVGVHRHEGDTATAFDGPAHGKLLCRGCVNCLRVWSISALESEKLTRLFAHFHLAYLPAHRHGVLVDAVDVAGDLVVG